MNKELTGTEIKHPSERDDKDLLELVCQLHSRALAYPSKHMHDAYTEARNELDKRLSEYGQSKAENEALRKALEGLWKFMDSQRRIIVAENDKSQNVVFKQATAFAVNALVDAMDELNNIITNARSLIQPKTDQ